MQSIVIQSFGGGMFQAQIWIRGQLVAQSVELETLDLAQKRAQSWAKATDIRVQAKLAV